jgi:multicomponent Na+:H+ antiporter subunit E
MRHRSAGLSGGQIAGLLLSLAVFWLINSGHFEPLLLGLGAFSILLVAYINLRKLALDGRYEPPVLLSPRLPGYLWWLAIEIVKSNLDVVRRVWQRKPDLSPVVFTLPVRPMNELVRTLYANSITLTPGTVTLEVTPENFEVHALTREAADGLLEGEMERRVSRLEH